MTVRQGTDKITELTLRCALVAGAWRGRRRERSYLHPIANHTADAIFAETHACRST
jgi:hypothetical protein